MASPTRIDVDEILVSVPDYIQKVQCDTDKGTSPFKCAVKSCPNTFFSFKECHKYPFKFHNFPKDYVLHEVWKKRCGWSKKANITGLKVCSDHFELDDYIRNYKEEFINPNFKRKLKSIAVPRKKIRISESDVKEELLESEEEILPELPCVAPDECLQIEIEEQLDIKEVVLAVDHHNKLKKTVSQSQQEERLLTRELHACEKEIRAIENKLGLLKEGDDLIHKVFANTFSDAQMKILLGEEKVYWSDDDMAKAFVLRQIGTKQCYLYMKNTLNFPLPALSAVQKWAASDHLS
ncbi:hypothetical protein JTB14_025877 [Gonioctena quinquepunctata]|nr:hypothetical protein JTB14_025877 [Gonioctena quinquepunctata]